MLEMYAWAWSVRSTVTLLLALCIFTQVLALVLSVYRQPRSLHLLAENCLELALLLHILCCSLLFGQVYHAYEATLIVPTGYESLRIATFGLVVFTALVAALLARRPWQLLSIPAVCMMLPYVEQLLGKYFSYVYVAVLLFYLVRSLIICIKRYGDVRTGISSRSVKNAIDSLRTGILFYAPDGFVLLTNSRMQQLMATLSGRVRRNGLHFYELLCSGELQDGCSRTELEGQIVCLMPGGDAWMFTKTELHVSNRDYIQLTATDITERWRLTTQLQQQDEQLRLKGKELGAALKTLDVLSREKETQNAKMRAHDILGQRLTLLLRTLRSEREPDPKLIHSLSQGLMEDLSTLRDAPPPREVFDDLCQVFAALGVDLLCSRPLPDGEAGYLLVDILRESATNAVRHGFATQVHAQLDVSDGAYCAYITNNGRAPSVEITEGGGLCGMRNKLKPHGGTLYVQTQPHFALTITLPGGGFDV